MEKNIYKILIAEDNTLELELLKRILEKEGFDILLTKNGKEMLENVDSYNPDLIILDVNMPIMNGYDACKMLKKDLKTTDIPVLFLTTNQNSEQVMEGFDAGAVDYIFKPFTKEKLISRIEKYLD